MSVSCVAIRSVVIIIKYFRQKSIATILQRYKIKEKPWICYSESYKNVHTHARTYTHQIYSTPSTRGRYQCILCMQWVH